MGRRRAAGMQSGEHGAAQGVRPPARALFRVFGLKRKFR